MVLVIFTFMPDQVTPLFKRHPFPATESDNLQDPISGFPSYPSSPACPSLYVYEDPAIPSAWSTFPTSHR